MFLIIGYYNETTIKHFVDYVTSNQNESSFDFLNLTDIQNSNEIEISFEEDLHIKIGNKHYDFSRYNYIYSRCFVKSNDSKINNTKLVNLIHMLTNYLDFCEKVVVNKPSAGHSNYSKLSHIQKLQDFGFKTPNTFIFGSDQSAKNILELNEGWISKGISSIRTKAVQFDFSLYSNLDLLNRTPSLFQQRITGFDVRIHLVGCELLALKIQSKNIDYRYDTTDNDYEEISIPPDIERQCINFCQKEELQFAGIDFKVNQNYDWFILEVNPMPGYNFFDRKMGNKISLTLFNFLNTTLSQSDTKKYKYELDRPFISPDRRTLS